MFESFEKIPEGKQELILKAGIREFSEKSYSEGNTDHITKECGISKGLLFHYFGSKKLYYEYCLTHALSRLMVPSVIPEEGDFYSIIFAAMDARMQLCLACFDEVKFVNMASRDVCSEAIEIRNKVMPVLALKRSEDSSEILLRAMRKLPLRETDSHIVIKGLTLYIKSIMNGYLLKYQESPEEFFSRSAEIKEEFREYLELFLHGVLVS